MPDRSPISLVPRHAPDDMVIRLEMLRDEAEAVGQGTLGYLIEMAIIEARHVSDQARRDAAEREVDPNQLWRPQGS